MVFHNRLDGRDGLLLILRDQDALAERQAVGLDDDGVFPAPADKRDCLVCVAEHFIGRCGDVVRLHQALAEDLARFDLRGGLVRAKRAHTGLLQRIHHTRGERVVGRDADEVDVVFDGEIDHALDIRRGNRDILGVTADPTVAGRAVDLFRARALHQFANDGVLTAAAADYENFHFAKCLLNGGTGACP